MTSLQYHCILELAEIKTLHLRDKIMCKICAQDALVKKYLNVEILSSAACMYLKQFWLMFLLFNNLKLLLKCPVYFFKYYIIYC